MTPKKLYFQTNDNDSRLCRIYPHLNSFKNFAAAEVSEITLKFGIKLGGEAGIPYVTKGTAESNIEIEIEIQCKYPSST